MSIRQSRIWHGAGPGAKQDVEYLHCFKRGRSMFSNSLEQRILVIFL